MIAPGTRVRDHETGDEGVVIETPPHYFKPGPQPGWMVFVCFDHFRADQWAPWDYQDLEITDKKEQK